MKDVFNWFVTSSADPEKYSLALKGTLLGFGAYALQASTLLCGFGILCLGIDADWLNSAIGAVSALVAGILYVIAAVQVIYGLARKVKLGQWSAPTN